MSPLCIYGQPAAAGSVPARRGVGAGRIEISLSDDLSKTFFTTRPVTSLAGTHAGGGHVLEVLPRNSVHRPVSISNAQ